MNEETNKTETASEVKLETQVSLQKGGHNWEVTLMGNLLLDCGDFYISYRGNTAELGSFFAGDDDGLGETALCFDGKYKILNGDFRKDYEGLVDEGLNKCLEFYESKKTETASCWTND